MDARWRPLRAARRSLLDRQQVATAPTQQQGQRAFRWPPPISGRGRMTKQEFVEAMAYLSAAIGKPLAMETAVVYFGLLGDLPADHFKLAVKRVALEHKWANFPTVAELREAAALTVQGKVSELSPPEAWGLAWRAAGRIDLEVEG